MRKFFAVVLVVLVALVGVAEAKTITVNNVTESTGDTDIEVAGVTTVYTSWFEIGDAEYFACTYWAYSAAGAVNITIQLEQSWTKPATDGSSDANYVIPVNMADVVTSLATESTFYIKSLSPAPMPYARFKIAGAGANNADAIVRMKFAKQI